MYQDYPGNFDTSSRGSSGSPGHPETYSSGAAQQVGPGAAPLPLSLRGLLRALPAREFTATPGERRFLRRRGAVRGASGGAGARAARSRRHVVPGWTPPLFFPPSLLSRSECCDSSVLDFRWGSPPTGAGGAYPGPGSVVRGSGLP